jgi:putative membrane protein
MTPADGSLVVGSARVIRWVFVAWAANAVVLGITGLVSHGLSFHDSFLGLIEAAAVFGVLNTSMKPILRLVMLPLAPITLGIASFFVSMLMLWLTDLIVGNFSIHGPTFWTYVWATVIIWVVSLVVDAIFQPRRGRRSTAAVSATA